LNKNKNERNEKRRSKVCLRLACEAYANKKANAKHTWLSFFFFYKQQIIYHLQNLIFNYYKSG
jgi:hypothetical protein